MAAAFEDIKEADKVALHVCVRIFKTVAHTRLSGQMNDSIKCVIGEEPSHPLPIGQIKTNKTKFVKRLQNIKTRLFQTYIIVAVKIVKADNAVPFIEETPTQVKTDEAGGAGD